MPRDITVTFANGTSHVYRGAPDDITPEQATARAQKDFPDLQVKALDGGRGSKPAAPASATSSDPLAGLRPKDAKSAWDQGAARLEKKIANLPEAAKKIARDRFFNDPRIQRLREISAQPVQNERFDIRDAKASAERRANNRTSVAGDFGKALSGGLKRGTFGLSERAMARAQANYGETAGLSEEEILEQIRANTDAELDKSLLGNLTGQIIGGAAIGGPVVNFLGRILKGTRAADAASKVARAAPKATKAVAITGAGAVGGGAQALGEGSDVATGAAFGAIGAPVVLGGAKALGVLARPFADMVPALTAGRRESKAGDILRRFTDDRMEDIMARADEYRKRTGSEPTLYELLSLKDRNRLAKQIIGSSPEVSEQAARLVGQRVRNVGPEMAESVSRATADSRQRVIEQMAQDMQAARGGVSDISDPDLAAAATRSPRSLEKFRKAESATIMGPVDNMRAADELSDFFPTELRAVEGKPGEVEEVFSNPDVNALIRNAAGSLRLRPSDEGLKVNEVMAIINRLGDIGPDSPDWLTAQNAVNHLLDTMAERNPQIAKAAEQMRSAYAARSRMMEGMSEGARMRTEDIPDVQTRGRGQLFENIYETTEGGAGRLIGQTNRLTRDFGGTPNDALRSAGQISESGEVQRALSQNLGDDAAEAIRGAAEAQARGVRNLASVGTETAREADNVDLQDLGRMLLAISPGAMPMTRFYGLTRLLRTATALPERRAKAIVDMLFSQDPVQTDRAIALLNGAGRQGREFLRDIRNALVTGQITEQAGQADMNRPSPVDAAQAAEPEPEGEEFIEEEEFTDTGDVPYGRAVIEALFPEAHVTDDLRDPDSPLGRANPRSYHVNHDGAVDIRPIPGMTFEEFISILENEGYEILEAINEDENGGGKRSGHATGNHWHVVLR